MGRVDGGKGRDEAIEILPEVPLVGSSFPRIWCENGASREDVARAARTYFQRTDPMRLVERVEKLMREGWELIWTPPYMASFQPIGLIWQHGN